MDLLNILFVLLFTLLGGIFSASEMAFVSLRESQIEEMARKSKAGQAVQRLTADSNRFLSAVQIGVTIAGFFSASFGAAQIAPAVSPFFENLGLSASAASTTAFIVVTVVIAYISIVFGELVPKRIAMQSAERLAKLEGLNGINMSQPHLNDMDKVFAATIDKGLHLSLSTLSFDIGKHDGSNLLFLDSM